MKFTLLRSQFQAVRNRVISAGVNIPLTDSGEITYKEVIIHFSYMEPNLTISVIDYGDNPSWIVNNAIKGWFSV